MATRVGTFTMSLTSLDSLSPKTLLDASMLEIYLMQAELYPILSKISLPWQRGLVMVEFVWHHSIARPQQPPVGRKYLLDISYTSRVIADLVSNFVTMTTRVSTFKIWLTSLDSPVSLAAETRPRRWSVNTVTRPRRSKNALRPSWDRDCNPGSN